MGSTRNIDWEALSKTVFEKSEKSEKDLYETYFNRGEYTAYFSPELNFFLTPYDSRDSARKVFESMLFDGEGRRRIFSGYSSLIRQCVGDVSWARQHFCYFTDEVMGQKYRKVEEYNGPVSKVISQSPSYFGKFYILRSIDVIQGVLDYDGAVDCVNYFVSSIAHTENDKNRRKMKLQELMDLVNQSMSNENLSSCAKELVEQLKAKETEIWSNWKINSKAID